MNEIVKDIVQDVVEEAKSNLIKYISGQVMKAILSKLPALAGGFFGTIISWGVTKVITVFIRETAMGILFIQIDKTTHKEAVDFNNATDKLAAAKKTGDKDAIAKAEQEKIDAARKLIKFGVKPIIP